LSHDMFASALLKACCFSMPRELKASNCQRTKKMAVSKKKKDMQAH
jgi:hypothetical protein